MPIEAAEETDGVERPLDVKLCNKKEMCLVLDFAPYELKTILLKISGKEQMPALTQPLHLDYDTDIFSYNSNREDGYIDRTPRSEGHRGTMDGKGGTYPGRNDR